MTQNHEGQTKNLFLVYVTVNGELLKWMYVQNK